MSNPHRSLDPFFKPQSVVVIGASANPGSVGGILMHNLLTNPFGGVVYPVNPKRKSIHGVRAYPDLASLPERPDLAILATPAATIPALVEECARRGIPAGIIISAGFSELGAEGKQLEQQIRKVRGSMRLIGPNCLGVIHPPSNLNASFATGMPQPGRVALLSQSGAICTAILDWAQEKHIGFSSFVSVGAMLDVDFADLLDYFADDPATRSIIMYMEAIGDVRKFLSAARSVARTKQVIVVKSGRHEEGARAAASHTGALAGADAVFDAAFRRAGILRVTTIPELFNMSEILALQPPPRGPGLAILTNAGGPGVMAVDALMTDGGQLAQLCNETITALNAVLPPFWSHSNPVDLLGDATPERYRAALEVCSKDASVHGLLVLLTPQAMTNPTETARQLIPYAKLEGKPILACWMGGTVVREGREVLGKAGIPVFDSPEDAIRAFLHMVQYRKNQELLYEAPRALPGDWKPETDKVRAIFVQARLEDRLLLSEAEAKDVLAAYQIPVARTVPCTTVEEAVQAAQRLGYPVVLKLLSATITHKSDVGGVQLDLANESQVREAFALVRANVLERARPEAFGGVTVQPMIRDRGTEVIVGSSVDRQFGPVILFGAGGTLVEVMQDRALTLPPLNSALARRLMERTRIWKALQGVRGNRPADLASLEALLVRFSQLLADFPEILEIDMNPVLVASDRVTALDARILLGAKDAPLPRLAIHPYPNQCTSQYNLRNGTPVTIRAIGPEDEAMLIALHNSHSERTLRMRFFSLVKTLSRDSLIRLCHLDYDREMALVAVKHDSAGDQILGVSRYYLNPETNKAEFALVVGDAYQRQGLGRHLMERLMEVAQKRGIGVLTGEILEENTPMLRLMQSLGFSAPINTEPGVARVERGLQYGMIENIRP